MEATPVLTFRQSTSEATRRGLYWVPISQMLRQYYALLPSSLIPFYDDQEGRYIIPEVSESYHL